MENASPRFCAGRSMVRPYETISYSPRERSGGKARIAIAGAAKASYPVSPLCTGAAHSGHWKGTDGRDDRSPGPGEELRGFLRSEPHIVHRAEGGDLRLSGAERRGQ